MVCIYQHQSSLSAVLFLHYVLLVELYLPSRTARIKRISPSAVVYFFSGSRRPELVVLFTRQFLFTRLCLQLFMRTVSAFYVMPQSITLPEEWLHMLLRALAQYLFFSASAGAAFKALFSRRCCLRFWIMFPRLLCYLIPLGQFI